MGNILVHVTEQSDQGTRLHLESLSSAEKICRIAVRTLGERTILCVRTSLLWPFRERKDVWLPGFPTCCTLRKIPANRTA